MLPIFSKTFDKLLQKQLLYSLTISYKSFSVVFEKGMSRKASSLLTMLEFFKDFTEKKQSI